jgi:1D-myo-inositol 3-kinase
MILLVGNLTVDCVSLSPSSSSASTSSNQIGGSVAYIGSIFNQINSCGAVNIEFTICGNVGGDFDISTLPPYECFRRIRVINDHKTTKFTIGYCGSDGCDEDRQLSVVSRCAGIELCQINDSLSTIGRLNVALVVPILGEIHPSALVALKSLAELCLLDVQGFIRAVVDESERLIFQHITQTAYWQSPLSGWIVKASRWESQYLGLSDCGEPCECTGDLLNEHHRCHLFSFMQVASVPILLLTAGTEGCTVLVARQQQYKHFSLPEGYLVEDGQLVDPTGAGDCFLAGFTASFARDYCDDYYDNASLWDRINEAVLEGFRWARLAVMSQGIRGLHQ